MFTRQSPSLGVETVGPRRVAVGKEATYEVTVRNTGGVAAEQVVVSVEIPEWTDVIGADASLGTTEPPKGKEQPSLLRWRVGRLEAKGRERLVLKIVPRQSRPFDLAVKWDYNPTGSQSMIEVQEPKLSISLQGPREVLFGKGEVYRLELANTGTGDAENVVLSLTPSSPGERQAPATHQFGLLAAGQKKSLEIELTARQTGDLAIQIEARAEGGIRAELSEKIAVRKPTLKVDVEAPKVHFVGTEGSYRIRVSNPGTAPASNVVVNATLPSGTKFISSPQGARLSDQNRVTWSVPAIAAGAETVLEMICDTTVPGVSRLDVQCKADNGLTATTTASTQVEALANLVLSVEEPTGPVLTGGEANYQVHVQNRGSAAATGVEVVMYFSNNFEPVQAEGGRHKTGPGQIVFEPISSIAAGQSVTLKVRAKADAAGSHIFRVEVRSDPTGTRLVREGTTRFYAANGTSPQATPTQPAGEKESKPVDPSPKPNASRTADLDSANRK